MVFKKFSYWLILCMEDICKLFSMELSNLLKIYLPCNINFFLLFINCWSWIDNRNLIDFLSQYNKCPITTLPRLTHAKLSTVYQRNTLFQSQATVANPSFFILCNGLPVWHLGESIILMNHYSSVDAPGRRNKEI